MKKFVVSVVQDMLQKHADPHYLPSWAGFLYALNFLSSATPTSKGFEAESQKVFQFPVQITEESHISWREEWEEELHQLSASAVPAPDSTFQRLRYLSPWVKTDVFQAHFFLCFPFIYGVYSLGSFEPKRISHSWQRSVSEDRLPGPPSTFYNHISVSSASLLFSITAKNNSVVKSGFHHISKIAIAMYLKKDSAIRLAQIHCSNLNTNFLLTCLVIFSKI